MGKRRRPNLDHTPFDPKASPQQKMEEFDAQIRQHGGETHPKPQIEGDWNPYEKNEDRRK
jgi:hypothetical protein